MKNFLLIIFVSCLLTACKSKVIDIDTVTPAQELYEAGLVQLELKKYKKASVEFEKIFFQHPGNSITPNSELMNAYSLYLAGEYDEAVDVIDIFIKLHPRHKNIDYAYYLGAISYYVQISDTKLDQSKTMRAKEWLEEVIARFPKSKYAIDAALKIDLVRDHLAGKEMSLGRYYIKKKNPIAAIQRFQTVVKKYDTTSHIAEALYRLAESNVMLGLVGEAKKYDAVLRHNYPNSSWEEYSKNLLK